MFVQFLYKYLIYTCFDKNYWTWHFDLVIYLVFRVY